MCRRRDRQLVILLAILGLGIVTVSFLSGELWVAFTLVGLFCLGFTAGCIMASGKTPIELLNRRRR